MGQIEHYFFVDAWIKSLALNMALTSGTSGSDRLPSLQPLRRFF